MVAKVELGDLLTLVVRTYQVSTANITSFVLQLQVSVCLYVHGFYNPHNKWNADMSDSCVGIRI